ncbi:hypothetical protein ACIF6L_26335 [Kitasatospora sp. NPDC086009]|uniref:hypothetical protein n=1 Tax=unclassified Kitasatospora TaxID=2633591 RepID=UPI0037C6AB7B
MPELRYPRYREPLAVPMYDSVEAYVYAPEFDPNESAKGCQCPRRIEGGCVEDLGLPGLQEQFRDRYRRVWTVLGRERAADPVSGRVRATTVMLRRMEAGRPVFKTIRCADAPVTENRYEQNRDGRPPAFLRLPRQPATPVDS